MIEEHKDKVKIPMDQQPIPPREVPTSGGEGESVHHKTDAEMRGDMLKEFIEVVHNIIPVLDQMKSSIHESSHKIPMASTQLNSVAHATETATVEILDVLDSITHKITTFDMLLVQLGARHSRLIAMGSEITRLLRELSPVQPQHNVANGIHELWREYLELTTNTEMLTKATTALAEVRNETMSIAMALQVQDITSQQIAGVIHLIESVRGQLTQVLVNLEQNGRSGKNIDTVPMMQYPDAFNADAQYGNSPERQEMADDIINEWSNIPPHKSE